MTRSITVRTPQSLTPYTDREQRVARLERATIADLETALGHLRKSRDLYEIGVTCGGADEHTRKTMSALRATACKRIQHAHEATDGITKHYMQRDVP